MPRRAEAKGPSLLVVHLSPRRYTTYSRSHSRDVGSAPRGRVAMASEGIREQLHPAPCVQAESALVPALVILRLPFVVRGL